MAELGSVNPTRMELLKQKGRLRVAQRAHDLLEDRRDELMRKFLPLVKEVRILREEISNKFIQAYEEVERARGEKGEKEINSALYFSDVESFLEIEGRGFLLSPRFRLLTRGKIPFYGFYSTSWRVDKSLRLFFELLPSLVKLAEKEEELRRLAREIERTRRRVNALKYIFIPRLEELVDYITMKLEERERAFLINLMKLKDLAEKT